MRRCDRLFWTWVVELPSGPAQITTRETFDHGWETMVFAIVDGLVDFGSDLGHTRRYDSLEEACAGHRETVSELTV